MVVDDSGNGTVSDLTIRRETVACEIGPGLFIYRTDDGRILTLDEACDDVLPILDKALRDQSHDDQIDEITKIDEISAQEFIHETEIYARIEVEGRIVTQYTDGRRRWTDNQLREHIFPTSDQANMSFEGWLAAQLDAGTLTEVDVLQYVGYQDEYADKEAVITERLIVD